MKKILSMVLVLVLALSCFAMAGASAAEEFTPSEEPTIYFEVPADWEGYSKIFCHIWPYGGGDPLANWQSKKEACKATETEGVYSYDISKVGSLEEGKMYCVIFSADTSQQTYDTFFDTNCYGDTLYCDETIYENPADSSKVCQAAFWKNQDPAVYGPVLQITSIGNVVGTAMAPGATAETLIKTFIEANLENALIYSGLTEDEIFANLAAYFELTEEEMNAIRGTSSDDEATPDEQILLGDADQNEKVNVKDATAVQKHVAGIEITIHIVAADADQNGKVNVKDATSIQKFVAGIEVPTPIGQLITIA